jgi:hypothetical protein
VQVSQRTGWSGWSGIVDLHEWSAAKEFRMSVADHFDHTPDAGFVRAYDFQAARRQFQVSVVLILVLAAAAFVLGMLVRFDPPADQGTLDQNRSPSYSTHQVHFAQEVSEIRD